MLGSNWWPPIPLPLTTLRYTYPILIWVSQITSDNTKTDARKSRGKVYLRRDKIDLKDKCVSLESLVLLSRQIPLIGFNECSLSNGIWRYLKISKISFKTRNTFIIWYHKVVATNYRFGIQTLGNKCFFRTNRNRKNSSRSWPKSQ